MAVRDDVVNTIAAFSLFADLTGPQLEEVAHLFDESFFGPGERVLRQGVSGSGFYVILEGTARVRADNGERSMLKAGDSLDETSCSLDEVPVPDIGAETPLRCLVLPAPQLEGFLTAHPRI